MSRIYEALKRAESEQKRVSGASTVQEPLDPLSRAPHLSSIDELRACDVREFAGGTSLDGRGDLLLESVPRRPWDPERAQLPTLGDGGAAVEQFRSLRSRLYQVRDHQGLRSILVSSGMPGEGKTFVAANLAISLARDGRSKVLLMDGDLRRGQLGKLLGAGAGPGLAEYLARRADLAQILRRDGPSPGHGGRGDAIIPNLSFVPAGAGGRDAAELASNRRFDELMASLAPHFDWILVDSSPVLPVSDAASFARVCDAVLLVVRAGVTPYDVAQRAHAEFRNSRVLGFVLNGAEPAAGRSVYGYDSGTRDRNDMGSNGE